VSDLPMYKNCPRCHRFDVPTVVDVRAGTAELRRHKTVGAYFWCPNGRRNGGLLWRLRLLAGQIRWTWAMRKCQHPNTSGLYGDIRNTGCSWVCRDCGRFGGCV
jgi:hypothetical protein